MARNRSHRRRKAAGLTAALAAGATAVALAVPAASDASFTLAQCGGGDLTGSGSSFQNTAQTTWTGQYGAICPQFNGTISYLGGGSGKGRTDMILRTTNNPSNVRYGGTDTAPSTTQRNQINDGDAANPNDNGTVHEIPVTVGDVAVVMNFPDGCTIAKTSSFYYNGDATNDAPDDSNTGRVKLDNATLAHIFAADDGYTSWGGVFGTAIVSSGAGGTPKTDAQCQDTPITRAVRFDDSGTTGVFKGQWLAAIDSDAGHAWATRLNRNWPNEPAGGDTTSGTNTGAGTPAVGGGANILGRLVRGNTNFGVAGVLNDNTNNDGSIGYLDLADAVNDGFTKTADTGHNGDTTGKFALDRQSGGDDTFWLPVQNGATPTPQYVEPTANQLAYKGGNDNAPNGAKPGANCQQATFTDKSNAANPPGTLPAAPSGSSDQTLGDWSKVVGVNAAQGYGVCSITYILAFDDNAVVYGNTATEEARARTLKDYLGMIVGNPAQTAAALNWYSKLPANIQTIAQNGVAAIGWNKAGVGQGSNNNGGGGGGSGGGGGGTTTNPPPVNNTPSNKFSITAARSQSNGLITMPVSIPGAGTLKAVGKTTVKVKKGRKNKRKKISYGRVTVTTSGAGIVRLKIKPSAAAKKALGAGQKLKVTVTVTFTPNGGTANSTKRAVTVKGKKKKGSRS